MGPAAQQPYRRAGISQLDAINQIQVDDRAAASPAELIEALRAAGPRAIATRRRLPAVLRALRLPLGPLGFAPLGYLTDLIYTRDMWMHRLDICRSTGREMVLTPEHDGRVVALVVRDLAGRLAPRLGGASLLYRLSGPAGGGWRIGRHPRPAATITLDALDFNLLASGRQALEDLRPRIAVDGDTALAERALARTRVPY
jgi:uncharacterized protein (TIGR03083 family)